MNDSTQVPFRDQEDGATAVEYALMVGFIAIVIVSAVTALGLGVAGLFAPVIPGL